MIPETHHCSRRVPLQLSSVPAATFTITSLEEIAMRRDWPISLIAQTTPHTCWVAATSMLVGRTIPGTGAWVGSSGGLNHQNPELMRQFLANYGLRAVARQISLRTETLQGWLCSGPIMIISGFRTGPQQVGTHALVVAGMDDDVFRFLDPSPTNQGSEVAMTLGEFSQHLPFNAFWAVQRSC
jgi:hypothetical protein